ncbi:MAG: TPM domain-containing protein [Cyanobacteria bacterium P01_G01_bin.38]
MSHRYIQVLSRWGVAVAIAVFALCITSSPAQATGIYELPISVDESTWVIDDANQITRLNEGKLSSAFNQLGDQTGNQVRVVTIHRLDYGETAQSLADKLLEEWFPTPEAQANQVVIVLDDVTNDVGMGVGDGAAQLLTPEIAESVTQETIKLPLVQGNKYNQAFLDASDRVVAVLSGQPDPGPPEATSAIANIDVEGTFATAEETEANRSNSTVVVIVLLVLATVIPMATYYWYQSIGG